MTYLEHLSSNDLVYLNSASRINYHLFALIMDIYNFKIFIHLSSHFASLDSTGKWHGAIEMINRKEVDFCLTPLRWENDRYGLVEHTTHSYHAQYFNYYWHKRHKFNIRRNFFQNFVCISTSKIDSFERFFVTV